MSTLQVSIRDIIKRDVSALYRVPFGVLSNLCVVVAVVVVDIYQRRVSFSHETTFLLDNIEYIIIYEKLR